MTAPGQETGIAETEHAGHAAAQAPVEFGPSALKLGAVCTLRESAALKAQLLEQLDAGGDVEIDAGGVEKIDTAGLQLLAAFAREAGKTGRAIRWTAVTPDVSRGASQLGLAPLLGLPAEVAQ